MQHSWPLLLFLLLSLFCLVHSYPSKHASAPTYSYHESQIKCPHLSALADDDIPDWKPTPQNPLAGRAPFPINETTNYYEYHKHNEGNGAYKRCSCPALNVLANRGFLPRDGKNITVTQFVRAVRLVYNFAEDNAFIVVLPAFAKNGRPPSLNLDAFNAPNVQHITNFPTSPFRTDIELGDNINLNRSLYNNFVSRFSADGETWTVEEMAAHHHLRHNQSKVENPKFRFGNIQAFGSLAQYANLIATLGRPGKHGLMTLHVSDMNTFMIREDLPTDYKRRELPYYNAEASAYMDRIAARIGFMIQRPFPPGDGFGNLADIEPVVADWEKCRGYGCRRNREGGEL